MRNKIILVLTGPICSGKTTLAQKLVTDYNFKSLSTRDALSEIYSKKLKGRDFIREEFQKFGEKLDEQTKGKWITKYFQEEIKNNPFVIIDSLRINPQIESLRSAFGYQSVFHIHLTAAPEILMQRYLIRNEKNLPIEQLKRKYQEIKADKTENAIEDLIKFSDQTIFTDTNNEDDVVIRAVSFLKIIPSVYTKLVDVIIGGQFGSEGKGQVAAYLAKEYDCLVRIGGPNAGHSVFDDPPQVFHILPSGTGKAVNSKLILGPGTIINLETLLKEIAKFKIETNRLSIDPNATIISKSDIARERKIDKIGSTAQGVGLAIANNIINRIKGETKYKAVNCKAIHGYIKPSHYEYEKLFKENKKILLEGTQGTFLSIHHGYFPHVTSRDTTVSGCLSDAGISPMRVNRIIMVVRTYPIRVQNPDEGTSGSFYSTEIDLKEISKRAKIPLGQLETIETTSTTKRRRRIAEFSWKLFRQACELNSPTDIALTFTDYLDIKNREAYRYEQLTSSTIQFIEDLEKCSGVPVTLISTDFSHRSIIDRRKWI